MGRIVIDRERCNGCELCIITCPYKLISLSREINTKGYHTACFNGEEERCTGDAMCAEMCPQVAIKVYR
ncbi:MAG: 4Fe-4S binding protein [Planctomycetes bacterium]|nr:4Fe-4S binding protein [Planctomycetota bacterium]